MSACYPCKALSVPEADLHQILSRDGRIEHQREPAVSPKLEDTGKDEVPTRCSSLPFYRTPSG